MISRGRGGRYSVGTNKTASANGRMSAARDLLMQQQRDYNGRKASFVFGDMIGGSRTAGIAGGHSSAADARLSPATTAGGIGEVWRNGPAKPVRDFARRHSGYVYNLPAKQAEWDKFLERKRRIKN